MPARACTILAAVVVLAWLGVMERDAHLLARGVETAGRIRGPADVARAEADFRGARLMNPDTAPDVGRALLYKAARQHDRAVALVEDVVRREPDNLNAWAVLFAFTRATDEATTQRALAARARLDPFNARRR
jgi:hypothetical protein